MQPASRPLDAVGVAVVLALCLSWGLNQVTMKVSAAELPPLAQATVRSLGAGLIVLAWALARRVPLTKPDRTLWPGIAAGVAFGLEFVLIFLGIQYTQAARAALFIFSAPFFVALGAIWLLPGERLRLPHWAGLALAFVGVGLALGAPVPEADPRMLAGDLMMIGAGALWGATTLIIKSTALARTSFEKVLLYQLWVSVPVLAVGALLLGETWPATPPSALAVGALAYQTVWVAAITYLVWFALLQRYDASRISAFTFLTPLFGVALSHLLLDEPLTTGFLVAAALVVGGLVLVNRR